MLYGTVRYILLIIIDKEERTRKTGEEKAGVTCVYWKYCLGERVWTIWGHRVNR